jgi:hypothetical protein
MLYCFSVLLVLDLPRFIPAVMTSGRDGAFWVIVIVDLLCLRLPIVLGGIWSVSEASLQRRVRAFRSREL